MMELINAVKAADLAAVNGLIGSGADVNQQDEQGWTPLNWAAGKGEIEIVKLLVESGADVFKVGRDQRTPYMIALAAGRVDAARFLRQAEDNHPGEKLERRQRSYCKAYYLRDLRQFSAWTESKINWKETNLHGLKDGNAGQDKELSDDHVVFLHQDLTVTESMWHSENVMFNRISPEWEEFCAKTLNFKVPDDLDFVIPS
jgi:ankyrin repeat protein